MIRLPLVCAFLISVFFLVGCAKQKEPRLNPKNTSEKFEVLLGGTDVGDLTVVRKNNQLDIDFGFSNNGRGASSIETLTLSDKGLPLSWEIKGKGVFGNSVDEKFTANNGMANWRASAGEGSAKFDGSELYVAQNASPYALFVYAIALLNDENNVLEALPGGQLTISKIDKIELKDSEQGTSVEADIYAINGIDLDPSYIALDNKLNMLAYLSPRFAVVLGGFAQEDGNLRKLAAKLNANRFERIAKKVTHKHSKPVRINNVRIFDPAVLALTEPKSVLINGNQIIAIQDVSDAPSPDEVIIEGKGGTLVPGMFEMHGHMSDNDALLNVMAGVTSVRDMGNEIDILDALIEKIDNNTLIGPRITRSGFIEGKSEFSAWQEKIEGNLRRANTGPFVDFRRANTEPSVDFRKANTEPSMHFRRANTETYWK